jgi:hypothetical protein
MLAAAWSGGGNAPEGLAEFGAKVRRLFISCGAQCWPGTLSALSTESGAKRFLGNFAWLQKPSIFMLRWELKWPGGVKQQMEGAHLNLEPSSTK